MRLSGDMVAAAFIQRISIDGGAELKVKMKVSLFFVIIILLDWNEAEMCVEMCHRRAPGPPFKQGVIYKKAFCRIFFDNTYYYYVITSNSISTSCVVN